MPKTRTDYWRPKLARNRERDAQVERELAELGWKVLVIWECEFKKDEDIHAKLSVFLGQARSMPK
jgi:DNA mismatch endonuclease (patch repair protein)